MYLHPRLTAFVAPRMAVLLAISDDGDQPLGRENNHVARHPHDPTRIYAGTVMGLNLSTDGGDTWAKVDDLWVVSNFIRWITFDKKRPEAMLVVPPAVVGSDDWGKSFNASFVVPGPRSNTYDRSRSIHIMTNASGWQRVMASSSAMMTERVLSVPGGCCCRAIHCSVRARPDSGPHHGRDQPGSLGEP